MSGVSTSTSVIASATRSEDRVPSILHRHFRGTESVEPTSSSTAISSTAAVSSPTPKKEPQGSLYVDRLSALLWSRQFFHPLAQWSLVPQSSIGEPRRLLCQLQFLDHVSKEDQLYLLNQSNPNHATTADFFSSVLNETRTELETVSIRGSGNGSVRGGNGGRGRGRRGRPPGPGYQNRHILISAAPLPLASSLPLSSSPSSSSSAIYHTSVQNSDNAQPADHNTKSTTVEEANKTTTTLGKNKAVPLDADEPGSKRSKIDGTGFNTPANFVSTPIVYVSKPGPISLEEKIRRKNELTRQTIEYQFELKQKLKKLKDEEKEKKEREKKKEREQQQREKEAKKEQNRKEKDRLKAATKAAAAAAASLAAAAVSAAGCSPPLSDSTTPDGPSPTNGLPAGTPVAMKNKTRKSGKATLGRRSSNSSGLLSPTAGGAKQSLSAGGSTSVTEPALTLDPHQIANDSAIDDDDPSMAIDGWSLPQTLIKPQPMSQTTSSTTPAVITAPATLPSMSPTSATSAVPPPPANNLHVGVNKILATTDLVASYPQPFGSNSLYLPTASSILPAVAAAHPPWRAEGSPSVAVINSNGPVSSAPSSTTTTMTTMTTTTTINSPAPLSQPSSQTYSILNPCKAAEVARLDAVDKKAILSPPTSSATAIPLTFK